GCRSEGHRRPRPVENGSSSGILLEEHFDQYSLFRDLNEDALSVFFDTAAAADYTHGKPTASSVLNTDSDADFLTYTLKEFTPATSCPEYSFHSSNQTDSDSLKRSSRTLATDIYNNNNSFTTATSSITTSSTSNSTYYTMDAFDSSVPSTATQSNAEQMFDACASSEYYSPSQQLQMEASRMALNRALTAPVLHQSASNSTFTTPLLVNTNSSSFSSMPPPRGLATAPIPSSVYAEPPSMNAVVEFDNLLASAYQSYLNTPANPLDLASPHFQIARSQQTPSASRPLFAPLDEIRTKDDAHLTNDLLDQLALNDPSIRQNLVHAIVDFIKPTVAYQLVDTSAPSTSTSAAAPLSSSSSLLSQAQTLASAAVSLVDEPATQQTPAMFSATPFIGDNGIQTSDGPLMNSLLGLLSPPIADAMTPLVGPLVTDVATPIILGMLDSGLHAKGGAMAPQDLLETQTAEDMPLANALAIPTKPKCSAKRAREDDEADEDAGSPKRFHCDICNRGFSRQYNMRTHRQTHEPQSVKARPFGCDHCPRTFTRKHDLVRHQVLHDDTSAFKCTICTRGFARQDVLERHARAVHKVAMD
ncbi:hypothetical protein LPJ57_002312, partial [Coemansia sp. RSA 486]